MLAFKDIENIAGLFNIKTEVICSFMEKHLKFASSIALSVIYGDEAYTSTIGKTDIYESSEVCNIHTRYNISSVSKIITGLLILKLEELGLLDIDVPISAYLKEDNIRNTGISIRMLMSHTSGLPNAKRTIFIEHDASLKYHVLSELNNITPISYPGEMFYYSNIGLNIAGYICELVTGCAFEELVGKYITANTLLLKDTGYDFAGNICRGTTCSNGKVSRLPTIQSIPSFYPSTQALSSLHDLSQIIYSLLNPNASPIVNEYLVKAMKKQHALMKYPNDYYCLTLGYTYYRNKNLFFHEGSVTGYFTRIYFIPEENFGIVILSNAEDPGFIERISHYILKKVALNSNATPMDISASNIVSPILKGNLGEEYIAADGKPLNLKIKTVNNKYLLEIIDLEKNKDWHGSCNKEFAENSRSIVFKSDNAEVKDVMMQKIQIKDNCCEELVIEGIPYTLVGNRQYCEMNRRILELAKGTYQGILVDGQQIEKCELKYVAECFYAIFDDENTFLIFPHEHQYNCFSTRYGMLHFVFDGEDIIGFKLRILQYFSKIDMEEI